jgi:hypothetical protein
MSSNRERDRLPFPNRSRRRGRPRSRVLRHKHGTRCFLRSRLFSPRKRLCQHRSLTEDDDDHEDEDDWVTDTVVVNKLLKYK